MTNNIALITFALASRLLQPQRGAVARRIAQKQSPRDSVAPTGITVPGRPLAPPPADILAPAPPQPPPRPPSKRSPKKRVTTTARPLPLPASETSGEPPLPGIQETFKKHFNPADAIHEFQWKDGTFRADFSGVLPTEQAACVSARIFGMTVQEIATCFGVKQRALRYQMREAYQSLQFNEVDWPQLTTYALRRGF